MAWPLSLGVSAVGSLTQECTRELLKNTYMYRDSLNKKKGRRALCRAVNSDPALGGPRSKVSRSASFGPALCCSVLLAGWVSG